MLDPHDDTDVTSGSTDGAQMESTSSPVPREHRGATTVALRQCVLPARLASSIYISRAFTTRICDMRYHVNAICIVLCRRLYLI